MQKCVPDLKQGDMVPSHGGFFEVIADAQPLGTLHPGLNVHGCYARVVTVGTFPKTYLETLPDVWGERVELRIQEDQLRATPVVKEAS